MSFDEYCRNAQCAFRFPFSGAAVAASAGAAMGAAHARRHCDRGARRARRSPIGGCSRVSMPSPTRSMRMASAGMIASPSRFRTARRWPSRFLASLRRRAARRSTRRCGKARLARTSRSLRARALIVESGGDSAARSAAQSIGIPVIALSPRPQNEAGVFELEGAATASEAIRRPAARGDDVALVLQTSGTTSQPKIVPLTQSNLCVSAQNVRAALELTERDRCLGVMPLFHVHGLVGALLSSLAARREHRLHARLLRDGILRVDR